ncbi:hypothetical protein GE061_002629 [Apolygus lucorum]|uniref:Uncharacterized protein n=1 Tax=Apolygus lucorum TaxID=248454 RepID=A0A8S9X720_APOLU|nr:hypothetical protein GE061_002629 [Apolygus lucorum]
MEKNQQLLERLEACSQRSGRRKSAAVGCQVPSFLLPNDIPFTKPEPSTMRYPGGETIDEKDGEEKRDMKKEGAEVEAKDDAKEEENVNSKEVAWKATEEKTDAKTDDIKGAAKEGAVSDVGCDKKEEKEVVLGAACEEKKIDEDSEERYDLQVLVGEKNDMEEMEGKWSKDDEDEAIELKDRSDVNGDLIHLKIGEDKENLIAGEHDIVEKHKYMNAKRSGRGSYNLDIGMNDARSVSVKRRGGNSTSKTLRAKIELVIEMKNERRRRKRRLDDVGKTEKALYHIMTIV